MRYDDRDRESSNVEDRRGQRGFPFPGGRGVRIPVGGRGGFSITTLLILGAVMLLFGINPLEILSGGSGGGGGFQVPQMPRSEQAPRPTSNSNPFDIPGLPGSRQGAPTPTNESADDMGKFVKRVLADTEDVWNRVFKSFGKSYDEPKLVLFTGSTRTACGTGMSAMGPFYCPLDQKIYVDLGFYEQLKRRFQAPGDFAQAYVIAHEVGHHVQKLLGIADKVQSLKGRMSERESNALQVRMELQADCLAGVWANLNDQLNNRLEQGDIEEGLNAASAIGDDMIQRRTQGHIVPDAFTHGSSAQRVRWFRNGYEGGQMQVCDTFSQSNL
ncbi:MAG: neutral zinc metallopeptidase [Hyphomicrobiaceae bacterium]